MSWSRPGIAPTRLRAQVENTAAWALAGPTGGAFSYRRRILDADAVEADEGPLLRYFGLLLAAHHTTCATFVPTDVDVRIRFHVFEEIDDEETLLAACDVVDEADEWDVPSVSARTLAIAERPDLGVLAGHDGEWFSVRAGALGRALVLRASKAEARLVERIDAELAREREVLRHLTETKNVLDLLRATTIVAHNLGDLSRVVDAWPKAVPETSLRAKYTRLGHTGAHAEFVRAGMINKLLMADENHRFLPLREARALRRSRAHLLPIGPFFDAWGRGIGRDTEVEDGARVEETFQERDVGEIVGALLEVHLRRGTEEGCLRALAGIDAGLRGGLARIAGWAPARTRKLLGSGPVRDAVKTSEQRFTERFVHRYAKLGL